MWRREDRGVIALAKMLCGASALVLVFVAGCGPRGSSAATKLAGNGIQAEARKVEKQLEIERRKVAEERKRLEIEKAALEREKLEAERKRIQAQKAELELQKREAEEKRLEAEKAEARRRKLEEERKRREAERAERERARERERRNAAKMKHPVALYETGGWHTLAGGVRGVLRETVRIPRDGTVQITVTARRQHDMISYVITGSGSNIRNRLGGGETDTRKVRVSAGQRITISVYNGRSYRASNWLPNNVNVKALLQ